jgi:hypothetical protein
MARKENVTAPCVQVRADEFGNAGLAPQPYEAKAIPAYRENFLIATPIILPQPQHLFPHPSMLVAPQTLRPSMLP